MLNGSKCRFVTVALGSALAAVLCATPALAERITMSGTRVMNDNFGTEDLRARGVDLDRPATVTRVMYGTYGFDVVNEEGEVVAKFLAPQQAVGLTLQPGHYEIRPYVCRQHRHHHVEVTLAY